MSPFPNQPPGPNPHSVFRRSAEQLRLQEIPLHALGEQHKDIVRHIDSIPASEFTKIPESPSYERAEFVFVLDPHEIRTTIERRCEHQGKKDSIEIYMTIVNKEKQYQNIIRYSLSYPRERSSHGKMEEDGLHYQHPEQRTWDFEWRSFQKNLLQHKNFRNALSKACEEHPRDSEDASKHTHPCDLLEGEVIVNDAEIFLNDVRDWWKIAHVKHGTVPPFPEKDIPYHQGTRPTDIVISHEEIDRRNRQRVDREGTLIYTNMMGGTRKPAFELHLRETGAVEILRINGDLIGNQERAQEIIGTEKLQRVIRHIHTQLEILSKKLAEWDKADVAQ